jgi:hypothetical protein
MCLLPPALIMDAVSNSVTSTNVCETARRNIPEDSHLNTHIQERASTVKFWNVHCRFSTEKAKSLAVQVDFASGQCAFSNRIIGIDRFWQKKGTNSSVGASTVFG